MKLSKKVGLIIGAVILVAALASVYAVYARQAAELRDLRDTLKRAEDVLPLLAAQRSRLEGQLAEARSSLEANQAKFPQAVESIEYGEYIFDLAEKCKLRLASLSFPKPTARAVGPVTYSVVSLTLPVSGTLENIFRFIAMIRTDPRFASAQVNSVDLDVGGGSATIVVDIYGYKR